MRNLLRRVFGIGRREKRDQEGAPALEWAPCPIRGADAYLATRDGRVLEVRKAAGGVWRLMVWKTEGNTRTGSAIVGIYADPGVAKYAAANMPLDDDALRAMTVDPQAAMSRAWNAAVGEGERQ